MHKVYEILNKISVISPEKIPELELYIDQVTTFLDDKLYSYKRFEKDKAITKTMINNYTKDKILPLSNKKKYSSEHLILLITIYHLKSTLSIEDISSILDKLKNNFDSLDNFYKDFVEIQSMHKDIVKEEIKEIQKKIEEISSSNNEEINLLYLVFFLVLEIELKKLIVEKIIDDYLK